MRHPLMPFRESTPQAYCRLFPPSRSPSEVDRLCENLTVLGRAMVDDGSRVSDGRPEILADCGYTYFGQLLAHDLTKDPSSLDEAWQKEPAEIANLRTPRLDLDSLYGGGPEISPELYEEDQVRLRVGFTSSPERRVDICVGTGGDHVLSDERNAENFILRQMTAAFARLHNWAVEQFESDSADALELFGRARQQTQWQFQWLVCHDYLPTLINREVYNQVFVAEEPTVGWNRFSIPIEFSAAAMRFGHAMVRENYKFAFGNDMLLRSAFGRTTDRGPLGENQQLNWGFFFQGAGDGGAVTARPIDTRLSDPLHNLPNELIGVPEIVCPYYRFDKHPPELAVRTLLRGAGLRLPVGQEVARAFGQEILTEWELQRDADGKPTKQGEILAQADLLRATPLWYYILKESELLENGNRVGPTGSWIIAETIHAALRADPDSYFNQLKPGKHPPIWNLPDERTRIRGLSELFRLLPTRQTASATGQLRCPWGGDDRFGSS
jgi:Animal haem peroxidase